MKSYRDSWTFFTNHAHVYFLIARFPELTVREIAFDVGITDRAVLGILHDLEEAKYIKKSKQGRKNVYSVVKGRRLRHPLEHNVRVQEILNIVDQA